MQRRPNAEVILARAPTTGNWNSRNAAVRGSEERIATATLIVGLLFGGCVATDDDSSGDDDGGADDTSIPDNDATVGDDDSTVGDDDSTVGDDDSWSTYLPACVDLDGDGIPAEIDCDDASDAVGPRRDEVCGDGLDNDCDGRVDVQDWHPDIDGDGFGDSNVTIETCSPGAGLVRDGSDCNDGDASIKPGVPDACGDGIDHDCNGGDGSTELCNDGIDGDCDGAPAPCRYFGIASVESAMVKLTQPQYQAYLGAEVRVVGDVTGDGRSDLVVVAPHPYPRDWYDKDGVILVVPGPVSSETQLASAGEIVMPGYPSTSAGMQVRGFASGEGAHGLGMVVGMPWWSSEVGLAGHVWAAGDSFPPVTEIEGIAVWEFEGGQPFELAGASLATGGDVSGDPQSAVYWGAPPYSRLDPYTSSLGVVRAIGAASMLESGYALPTLEVRGDVEGGQFGSSIDVGDFNGDGVVDILAGAPYRDSDEGLQAGAVFLLYGPRSGRLDLATGVDARIDGEPREVAGRLVKNVGDLNLDGADDACISASTRRDETTGYSRGAVHLVLGPTCGVRHLSESFASWIADAPQYWSEVYCVGGHDLNRDGWLDLVISDTGYDNERGAVFLVYGPFDEGEHVFGEADLRIEGEHVGDHFGLGIDVGDITSDGIPDIVVGASTHSGEAVDFSGAVYVFSGAGGF